MGTSINTRNVSFQERFIIREIMPSVLMNVLSSTLTLRHTALPIRVVSLDNLDVISPTQKIQSLHSVLFCCSVMFLFYDNLMFYNASCPVFIVSCLDLFHWPCRACITRASPVFVVSKNPISCLVKAPNSWTLILHVKALMAHIKKPPLQPALKELTDHK